MMLRFVLSLCCALFGASVAQAQETGLVALQTGNDSRGWEGVGRLDIFGKGFCTAALIREDLILTAAHCLYDDDGKLIAAERFEFNAGLRDGRAEATRMVTRTVAHPDYRHSPDEVSPASVAVDIAVLQLQRPIRTPRIQPYPIAERPRSGDKVGVVSYARDRAEAPSLQEVCSVIGRQPGTIVMTCDVDFGSSGAPVFIVRDGVKYIVSVVSQMAVFGTQQISLGTSLQEPLVVLLAHYATVSAAASSRTQRLINIDERRDTGAKFVRP